MILSFVFIRHDFLHQTPQVPNNTMPHPDGACVGYCDCGAVPCGEYLFDHRNASLTRWLLDVYLADPAFVDGYFIDDYWRSCLSDLSCAKPNMTQGPSEVGKRCVFAVVCGEERQNFFFLQINLHCLTCLCRIKMLKILLLDGNIT
jgi:hypothetical protein